MTLGPVTAAAGMRQGQGDEDLVAVVQQLEEQVGGTG